MEDPEYVGLKTYIDVRFEALDKQIRLLKEADEKAIQVALKALNDRMESMNEFRAQMGDQSRSFATRNEVEIKNASFEMELKSIQRYVWMAIGAGGLLGALASLLGFVLNYFAR